MKLYSRHGSSHLPAMVMVGGMLSFLLLVIIAVLAIAQKKKKDRDQAEGEAGFVMTEQNGELVKMDESQPTRVADQDWLTEFNLTSSQKEKVTNATLLGKPYVISFFYSTCPSVCVRQNEKKKSLYEKFADKGIRFVSVSVDPEIDTPERLAEYAERFNADPAKWLFLTGDMDYISRVGAEVFRIFVTRRGHPEQFIVVDAEGKIYGYYNWTDAEHFLALQKDLESFASDPNLRASDIPKGREKKPAENPDEESEESAEPALEPKSTEGEDKTP